MEITKKYEIKSEKDCERILFATLKKVFSCTTRPRVLVSETEHFFNKNGNNFAFFDAFTGNFSKFKQKVHKDMFDIGLYFFEKNKKKYLKVVDGTGLVAGSFTTNIFFNMMTISDKDFQKQKIEILDKYEKAKEKKLLEY